ncbi:MAG TPA: hypothetical protein V6C52_14995 [Coleofasciculaceae cyanobacterium]|jgi:hypothetical protein
MSFEGQGIRLAGKAAKEVITEGVANVAHTTNRARLNTIGQDFVNLSSRDAAAEPSKSIFIKLANILRNLPSFIGQFFRFILGEGEQATKNAAAETVERTGQKFAESEESDTIANLRKQLAEAQSKNEASEVETASSAAGSKTETVASEADETMAKIARAKEPELGLHQESVDSLAKTIKKLSNGQMTGEMARENADAILSNAKWALRTDNKKSSEFAKLLKDMSVDFADKTQTTPAKYIKQIEDKVVQLLAGEEKELAALAKNAEGGVSSATRDARNIVAARRAKFSGGKVKEAEVLRLFDINDILNSETEKAKLSDRALEKLQEEKTVILEDLNTSGATEESVIKNVDSEVERLKQVASGTGLDHVEIKQEALDLSTRINVTKFKSGLTLEQRGKVPGNLEDQLLEIIQTQRDIDAGLNPLKNKAEKDQFDAVKNFLKTDLKDITTKENALDELLNLIKKDAPEYEKELLQDVEVGVSAVDEACQQAVAEEISSALMQAVRGDSKITVPERGLSVDLVKDFLEKHGRSLSTEEQAEFQVLKGRITSFGFDPEKLAAAAKAEMAKLKQAAGY